MSKEDLPSIGDFAQDNNGLPSVNDFLKNEVSEDLPSVEDFVAKKEVQEIKEETQTIEDLNGNTFAEVEDIVPPWPELIRLINDVREEIPDIPEIKYYDKELEDLTEQINLVRGEIPEVPEVKYYDTEIEAICEQIDLVRDHIANSISELPEVKYYDEQIDILEEKLSNIKNTILELPEVRYYENDIQSLKDEVERVRSEIPTFPKWVNEVNEVPDFSWIGKTFSVIDDDFIKVNDTIETLRDRIELDINNLIEENNTKLFENNVEIKTELQERNKKYQEEKDKIWKQLRESSLKIWEYHKEFKDDDRKLKKQILGEYNTLKQSLEKKIRDFNEDSVKTDNLLLNYFEQLRKEISDLPEVKYYDEDIRHVKSDIKDLFELVKTIKTEQKEIKDLQEGLLNEPPNEKESIGGQPDPLTPMDRKFATLDDLASHYRIFINRIQQQIATIGGGGAGFIKDLDDVVFDAGIGTNKLLIFNGSQWVGIASTALTGGAGVGAGGTWGVDSVGIHTVKAVGVGTTSAKAGVSLYVVGDAEIAGNISVAGTITYEDVTNVDSIGIITARSDVEIGRNLSVVGLTTLGSNNGIGTVYVGLGSTALYVDGSARIIGILTVGRASVTIDGDNNTITSGIVTITNSQIYLGDNITISGGASGINSAPNVIYVAKDGNDSNNGTSIDNAKLTISGAVGVATTGTIIKVLAGNYAENNPVEVPPFVSIVGDDLKTVTVTPNTANKDIFHVRKGCYVANMTFTNHVAPAAAIGFPTTEIAGNDGGGKWESPYIQNCTSNTTTGTGLRVDGAQAEGLKSIVCDSYTQYNQGGVGVAVTNEGFAQLVSVFTICCNEAISCYKGGQVDLTNSNSSFGTYGLVADGVSNVQFTGVVTTTAAAGQDNVVVNVGSGTTRPYDGQLVYFDTLYQSVETIAVSAGGTGYTSTPTVTIDASTGPNGETATAFATLDGESVSSITVISSGTQYTSTPNVIIGAPNSGSNTASATASMAPIYYTINSSTPVTAGITTLTLDENLINTVGVASTAYFYQVSRIVASSHTFEYVGSGNDITTATPKRGGVTIQENEVVTTNGGKVVYTSTDQAGNFRIGDELQINQNTGTISGRAFSRSLFTEMTPFILALS